MYIQTISKYCFNNNSRETSREEICSQEWNISEEFQEKLMQVMLYFQKVFSNLSLLNIYMVLGASHT